VLLALSGHGDLTLDDVSSVSCQSDRNANILIGVNAEVSWLDLASKLVGRIFAQGHVSTLLAFILEDDGLGALLSDGDVLKVDHGLELDIWTGFESVEAEEVGLRVSLSVDFN